MLVKNEVSNKKATGKRAKTRDKLKRRRAKATVNVLLNQFDDNESVEIKIDSSKHAGMPFHRFHGKTGKVKKKQGNCYLVNIRDGKTIKAVLAGPAHLHKVAGTKGESK